MSLPDKGTEKIEANTSFSTHSPRDAQPLLCSSNHNICVADPVVLLVNGDQFL